MSLLQLKHNQGVARIQDGRRWFHRVSHQVWNMWLQKLGPKTGSKGLTGMGLSRFLNKINKIMQNRFISYYSYIRYLAHHAHKVGTSTTTRNETCTTQACHHMNVSIALHTGLLQQRLHPDSNTDQRLMHKLGLVQRDTCVLLSGITTKP